MISIRGASEHNLKSVDLDIPRRSLTVVTGVSGSGKSSLAFDTICAEGRRRYLETFSSYARQFLGRLSRPAVARIDGLSPAVALTQAVSLSSPRSTVGTMTELYDLLRLMWARTGTVAAASDPPKLERALFSFNSPRGACPQCRGLGVEDRLDPELLVSDPAKSVRGGALRITTPSGYVIYSQVTLDVLDQVCHAHGFSLDIPWQALTAEQRDVILNGSDRIRIPYGKHPLSSRLRWKGITAKPREEGVYKGILPVMEQILRTKRNRNVLRFVRSMPCGACGGTRLRPEALAVTVRGRTIAETAALSIDELRRFFENETDLRKGVRPHYKSEIDGRARTVETAIAAQVIARCGVLQALGLGHLTLDRASTTLSAGEAHRIRLARLTGVGLAGVLYVLDEPSVGLHHRDTRRLLDVLRAIRDQGNTVLVVEHDEQTVRSADWIVDIGPAAGAAGGELLYSGPAADFIASGRTGESARLQASRTHAFLTGRERIEAPATRRNGTGRLVVSGITKHNLEDVVVEFRLGTLNVVTGVSGAGKSTLVEETARLLGPAPRASRRSAAPPRRGSHAGDPARSERTAHVSVHAFARSLSTRDRTAPGGPPAGDGIDKVIAIDQAPIGRTPRSNPATYTALFDGVRDLFAAQPDAVRRGFGKGRFSFNVKGGRCETCEGAGVQQIGMHFLGTVSVVCDTCAGRRFNDDTLEVRYRGRTIHDVLDMPIEEAAGFFVDQPPIAPRNWRGRGPAARSTCSTSPPPVFTRRTSRCCSRRSTG
jgi:excinuclease ABC subunit A